MVGRKGMRVAASDRMTRDGDGDAAHGLQVLNALPCMISTRSVQKLDHGVYSNAETTQLYQQQIHTHSIEVP